MAGLRSGLGRRVRGRQRRAIHVDGPFNAQGLFDAMGGRDARERAPGRLFHNADGRWALTKSGGLHAEMSNEPSIKSPWLYDYSGRPDKTQQTIRQVVDSLWSDSPDGIPGNDDLGEMSAWYVWAAMGMYPEVPDVRNCSSPRRSSHGSSCIAPPDRRSRSMRRVPRAPQPTSGL